MSKSVESSVSEESGSEAVRHLRSLEVEPSSKRALESLRLGKSSNLARVAEKGYLRKV